MSRWMFVWSVALGALGCTSFSTVRTARVSPGSSVTLQASVASRPGDDAAWFWNIRCPQNCDRVIPSADIAYGYGRAQSKVPHTVGGGLNGASIYVEGYAQISTAKQLPFGVGGRLGVPLGGWSEHQMYARADLPLGDHIRLVWNPGIFYRTGDSNGTSGSFLGLVQGFGVALGPVTPSVAIVWGRTERTIAGNPTNEARKVFAAGALSVTVR